MNAGKHFAAAGAVVAIFGAGIVLGRWSVAHPPAPPTAPPMTAAGTASVEARWSHATLEEYGRRLQLTPAQVVAIRPIIHETSAMMTQMRSELRTNLHATVRKMNERVSSELTGEQRRQFVALIQEKLEEKKKQ